MGRYFILLLAIVGSFQFCPAKIVDKSDSKQPEWVRKGESKLNSSKSNDSYYFKVVESTGSSLDALRDGRILALSQYVGNSNHISGSTRASIQETANNDGVDSRETYEMQFTNELGTSTFYAKVVDEYWELHSEGASRFYSYYVLFAVSSNTTKPHYDSFSTTTSYGGRAFARSLVPGWGQIYKGQTGKGIAFMTLEAAAITGIILSESNRVAYANKVIEQPKFAKEYHTRSTNWATARNICIGAAGAVYLWNLIDALAAKGARRVVVRKGYSELGVYPSVSVNHAGLGLTYNF